MPPSLSFFLAHFCSCHLGCSFVEIPILGTQVWLGGTPGHVAASQWPFRDLQEQCGPYIFSPQGDTPGSSAHSLETLCDAQDLKRTLSRTSSSSVDFLTFLYCEPLRSCKHCSRKGSTNQTNWQPIENSYLVNFP